MYAAFYLFFVLILAVNYKTIISTIVQEKWVMIIWIWALSSTLWSVEPDLSFRRSIALLGVIVVGLFVAMRFEPFQQIKLVATCIAITAVASLFAAVLDPSFGIAGSGEWKGIFFHKNVLGHTMALGIFCFCFLTIGEKRRRWLYIPLAVLCGALLLLSRSVTAAAVCLVMLAVLRFRNIFRLPLRTLTMVGSVFALVAVPAGYLFFSNIDAILLAVGRDPTLTGRVPLWHAVAYEISKRPVLGYGYTAFWYSVEGDRVHSEIGWLAMHSHDGYLETTLALGFIGMILLLMGLAANFVRGLRIYRETDSIETFWPFFFLIFMAVDNIAETWMMKVNSLIWMLYIANTYWIVRAGMQAQASAAVPVPETDLDDVETAGPAGFRPVIS